MAAYLRRTDQDLERTAKAAAPARDDLVMHFLLRRGHLDWADLSVTGRLQLPAAAASAMILTAALFGKTPACQTNLRRDRVRVEPGPSLGVARTTSSAQARHLAYGSAAVDYFRPDLSASRSTRKSSRQAANSATPRPAVSAVIPAVRRCFNSDVSAGLPKLSHQSAIGVANWSRK